MKQSKKKKLFGGLTAIGSLLLSTAIGCTMLCYDWALLVDLKLGIQSGSTASGEIGESSVYFKSAFGDISALYKTDRTAEEQTNLTAMQEELVKAEKAYCERESEEGCVLLKNGDVKGKKALPLSSEKKITLFGYAAGNPVYRSSSGSAASNVAGRTISLADALRASGYSLNEGLQAALEGASTDRVMNTINGQANVGELEVSFYNSYKSTFSSYSDAAIVVLNRTGGEGIDLNTCDADGISQLALHREEKELLQMIQSAGVFEKTIVLIDSGYPMELDWLNDESYGVDACLWIGNPGMYGFAGVANLLSGKANPSGRLVDTYAANSLSAPAMQNFGDISFTNNSSHKYIVEAEGIYVGYKYYETRYEDCIMGKGSASSPAGSSDGQSWNYAKEVTFPFGYGLSYTTFSQKIGEITYDRESDSYTVPVTVENTGSVAGKCVVQLYAQVPYDGVTETSAIRLVGFDKTLGRTASGERETKELSSREAGVLYPGEKEVVNVTVDKYFLTSYSTAANGGKGGYVLTSGDYYLAAGENAHEALNNILALKGEKGMFDENGEPYIPSEDRAVKLDAFSYDEKTYSLSPYTGEKVENKLVSQDINYWQKDSVTYLSRSDWAGTYPTTVILSLTDEMKKEMDAGIYKASADALPKGTYTQGTDHGISFIDMKDVPYTGTYIDENGIEQSADERWEKFLDQIQTVDLIANTTNRNAAITYLTAPMASHGDGPDGIQGTLENGNSATCYNSEIVAASSFNPKILRMRGDFEAEDSLFAKFTVMWGTGANIHRTPFSGRNFEYYSECGYMSYLCASYQISSMREKGLITCIKHFAGNDQETNRTGVATFNQEQAWRENAMKAFEGGIAKGGSLGVMTSFSLIGCTSATSCAATNYGILRDEWGFKGINITDSSYQMSYMNSVDSIMNGTTMFCLDNREADLKKAEGRSKYDDILSALRQANKQFYYALLRSNAANGIVGDTVISNSTSWWKTALILVDSAIGAATLSMAGLYLAACLKKEERE